LPRRTLAALTRDERSGSIMRSDTMKISHLANFLMIIIGGAAQEAAQVVRRKLQGRIARGR
jgi:hypothetical protein